MVSLLEPSELGHDTGLFTKTFSVFGSMTLQDRPGLARRAGDASAGDGPALPNCGSGLRVRRASPSINPPL